MHACTHTRTHMHNAARARRRRHRTAHCDTATARGNARRREVPAGCACAAARAASPGVRFKELCPKAASPAGPHVPFWDTAPPPQARGLPIKQQDGALAPGRTVPGAGQRGIVPLRCAIIRRRPKSERGYPSGQRSPFTAIP